MWWLKTAFEFAPLVAGVYLLFLVSMMTTHTARATVMYQTVPLLLGIMLIIPFAVEALR
jgi:hypothetical protein